MKTTGLNINVCIYFPISFFRACQSVAMPNQSRTCRIGPSTHSRTLTSLSLFPFQPFPVGSTTLLPSEKRQTKKHPHKGSQTNIALMQSERRKETRQEQQPQKKNKTKGIQRGPGAKQTVIRRPPLVVSPNRPTFPRRSASPVLFVIQPLSTKGAPSFQMPRGRTTAISAVLLRSSRASTPCGSRP